MEDTNTTTDHPATDAPNVAAPTTAVVISPQLMAAAFKAAADATSTDDNRAVLNHVKVTATVGPDGASLELQGCDSYRLQTVTVGVDADLAAVFGDNDSALLPRSFILAASKLMAPKKVPTATVTVTAGAAERGGRTVTVTVDGASVTADEYIADYPNTAALRFDPAAGVPCVAGFDPIKVAAVHKSVSYFGDRSSSPTVVYRGHRPQGHAEAIAPDRPADNPALRPAIWTATGSGWTFEALLMPVRLP